MNEEMLEELIEKRIYFVVNCILSKFIKPTMKIDKVNQLDEKVIDELIEQYGIEAVILDVDDTLRRNMNAIPKCNQDWVDMVKSKLKIIIVSNGIDKNVEKLMQEKGINYIGFAHKPLKKNFIKACELMNVKPENVLVVGDSLWSDIYGGNRSKMKTAIVKDVEER